MDFKWNGADKMGFVEASKTDELKDGQMKMTVIDGHEILVAKVADKYYASDNRCPHMGGDLSKGKLEGTVITCPRHHSQFDLVDGHNIRWTDWTGVQLAIGKLLKSPRNLKTYDVKIDEDIVMVDIK